MLLLLEVELEQRVTDYFNDSTVHPPELFASVLVDPRVNRLNFVAEGHQRDWISRGVAYFKAEARHEVKLPASQTPVAAAVNTAAARFFDDLPTDHDAALELYKAEEVRVSEEIRSFMQLSEAVPFEGSCFYEEVAEAGSGRTQRRWVQKEAESFSLVAYWNDPSRRAMYPLLSKLVQRLLVVRIHSIDAERVGYGGAGYC